MQKALTNSYFKRNIPHDLVTRGHTLWTVIVDTYYLFSKSRLVFLALIGGITQVSSITYFSGIF
ncbi:hypothetical protein FWK45_10070 [Histophilus somni]|uniref:Uncharacterized protein n=1 Tax=Histophilus somni TaxID=731 RepID=A0AAX2S2D2_HISSO|nr:hypothetical protein [Histophilus somni]QEH08043.1 hypothetical protein FWK43_00205 [Histophilus somni]QEH13382.1 hypothetical protein FWK44_10050 [Histophilus somni]QEH24314.1 hypothetical protein FWK61_00205 [Histophilus somni]QEH27857.1 hypothetical protein FWK62_10085 [Histophilus somni]QEH52060.1 hypothetical protein FWK45_10070 [Histophilus somni]